MKKLQKTSSKEANLIKSVFISLLLFTPLAIHAQSFDLDDGCFDWVIITELNPQYQKCPSIGNWRARPLFDAPDNSSLSTYCVFENPDLKDTKGKYKHLPKEINYLIDKEIIKTNATKDCAAVATLAGYESLAHQELYSRFDAQTGRSNIQKIASDLYPVRLAVLDTVPTESSTPLSIYSQSGHGKSLLDMTDRLICQREQESGRVKACFAKLTSQLALGRVTVSKKGQLESYWDDKNGGYFGTISELATAINKEVESWKNDEPDSKLILNLSLGWNPHLWGGWQHSPNDYNAAVKSVYHAIETAVCHGAIVIAAAGNTGSDARGKNGAMLPAKWEELEAPNPSRCHQLGIYTKSHGSKITTYNQSNRFGSEGKKNENNEKGDGENYRYQSLVYAASGIDSIGNKLTNARVDGFSRMAAYGDHGISFNPNTNKVTDVLTGSSVSTIVASASAAAVWANRPDLNNHEVINLVYQSGDPLPFAADFTNRSIAGLPQVNRISLCNALNAACKGGICEAPKACHWQRDIADYLTTGVIAAFTGTPKSLASLSRCAPNCPSNFVSDDHSMPWTDPQPDQTPCPNCWKSKKESSAYIAISSSYAGTLTDPILTVNGVDYYMPSLSAGFELSITNVNVADIQLTAIVDGVNREVIPLLSTE